jgi:hypothetical protein
MLDISYLVSRRLGAARAIQVKTAGDSGLDAN